MKDKSIKQPWPRSARVTVWVLGILLAGFAVLYWDATTDYDDGFIDDTNIHRINRRVPELPDSKQAPTKTVREL